MRMVPQLVIISFKIKMSGNEPVTFSLLRSADDIPECVTVDKQIVNTCLLHSDFISTLTGGGADITNVTDLITIVDIIGNLCGGPPITLAPNFCIDLSPGFCSSVIQNINNAWGIYRAPGMTEITVGSGGDGVAPGANFPDVGAALGAPATPSDCNFIRITSDTVDGSLVLRPNTLIYVDPGVNWTVTGQLTISGDFILMGATPIPSARVTYGGAGLTFINGAAGSSVFVQNMHLIHALQLNPLIPELFVNPIIATRMSNVVIDVGTSVQGFLSDVAAPFTNMTLEHVTLQGTTGSDLAIQITNAASIFRSSQLEIDAGSDFTTVITCADAATPEWNGIRHLANSGLYRLTGTVSDFQDISGTSDVTIGSTAQLSNIAFNILRFIAGTIRVQVTNASGTLADFVARPPNLTLSDFVTNQLVADSFIPGANAHITNFTVQTGASITSLLLTSGTWNNVFFPGNWRVTSLAALGATTQLTNIRVVGNCELHTGNAGGIGQLLIKHLSCVDFTLGNIGIGNSGRVLLSGLRASGNALLDNNRNNFVCRIENFWIGGNFTTLTMAGEGGYSNGFIGGNLANMAVQAIRQMYDNIEVVGDVTIGGSNCNISNMTCLGPGMTFTITPAPNPANNTVINGLNTLRVSGATAAGGLFQVLSSNNVITNVNLIGSSVLIGPGTQGNTLTNWRVQGGGAGPQTFRILGSSQKLSNIMLGCPVNDSTDDFTINGFGSSVTGAFTVDLGNPLTAASRGLQVDNFSVYPKRGQTIVAGVGDISGAIAAPAARIINISMTGGVFNNCHFWFYPGGDTTGGTALIGHIPPTTNVNVTPFTTQSQFQNIMVGFGNETPNATPFISIGTLNVTGAGNSNTFQSCTAVAFVNDHANSQFNNCNGFAFATTTPANFITSGANTIINQCNFGIAIISAINAKLTNSVITSCVLNGLSTGAVVARNRFLVAFTIAPAPPAPLPLVVGNVGSGAAPVNSHASSTGNY